MAQSWNHHLLSEHLWAISYNVPGICEIPTKVGIWASVSEPHIRLLGEAILFIDFLVIFWLPNRYHHTQSKEASSHHYNQFFCLNCICDNFRKNTPYWHNTHPCHHNVHTYLLLLYSQKSQKTLLFSLHLQLFIFAKGSGLQVM